MEKYYQNQKYPKGKKWILNKEKNTLCCPSWGLTNVRQCLKFVYTRSYSPLCGFTSSSYKAALAFGRGFFCPSGKKKFFKLFWLTLSHFWCSVVTSVTFSSNLRKKCKKTFFKKFIFIAIQ